jgi:hypothetical protein
MKYLDLGLNAQGSRTFLATVHKAAAPPPLIKAAAPPIG